MPPTDSDRPSGLARWYVSVVALVPIALTAVAVRFTQPAAGTDAVAYIAVADSLRAGDGLGFFLERPLTTWPPLWPVLLAVGSAVTGWRGDLVAVALNAVMLVGVVLLSAAVVSRILSDLRLRALFVAGVAVSPLLIGLGAFVQTEVAFVLLSLLTIWLLLLATERHLPVLLVTAGLVTSTGFYIRYQALYVVVPFALWLAVRAWRQDRRLAGVVTDVCWYAVPAVVPSVAWMLRNLSISDTAMGPRFPSSVGPLQNLAAAFRTTAKFVTSIPDGPNLVLAALGVVIVTVVVATAIRTQGFRPLDAAAGPVGLLSIFVTVFTALMVVSRSIVGFDDLDIRLLAPSLVPTALLFLRWVELVLLDRPRWRTVGWTVAGVWLGTQVLLTLALLGPLNSVISDVGYNAPRAVAASRSPALTALPEGCVLYSNNSADIYRSQVEALISPRRTEYKSDQPTDDLEELQLRVDAASERNEQVCLVWVEYSVDPDFHDRADIAGVVDLREVASADGVTSYVLAPRNSP
ncbi:MAG: glycosyltransferase family 39 protein [Actinobacteria bacterium]|nr:glycosyltransferase family 39 protein [Actinomycetota bacterium]